MSGPHITILMATLNGAQHLPTQLNSLLGQTHQNWSLVVSDDGSRDATMDVLLAFDRAHPGRDIRLVEGPRQGSAAQNFLSLLMRPDVPPGLVALADQDDYWRPHKLARAVEYLSHCPPDLPTVYASESILTDASLIPYRVKPAPRANPSFRNALVQNLFSGHTTVLNAAALSVIQTAGTPSHIAFHDWWIYQLIAGTGGLCLLDPAQTVLYRQHGGNAFGAAYGLRGAIRRLSHLLRNDYGRWLSAHWHALHDAAPQLTPDARDLIRDLLTPHHSESRAAQFRRLGLHRGSAKGTVALEWAAHLGRL